MTIKFTPFLLITAVMLASSCKKGYLNINEVNPNQTENPPINGLLANVTSQTGLNVYRAGNITAYYVQQLASPNASSGSDIYDNVDRSSMWYNVYNTIRDSRVMLDQAITKNGFEHIGVAKVTEAMNMSLLIDLFGDAPYTEAFDPTNFRPRYDKAEDIFNACLKLLDEALVEFGKTNSTIKLDANSDLIHSGSINAWKKQLPH